jgi:hypothetical protein
MWRIKEFAATSFMSRFHRSHCHFTPHLRSKFSRQSFSSLIEPSPIKQHRQGEEDANDDKQT